MYFSTAVCNNKFLLSFTWITISFCCIIYYEDTNKIITSQYLMDLLNQISTVVLLMNLCENKNNLNFINLIFFGRHSMFLVIMRSDADITIDVHNMKEPSPALTKVGVCMLDYLCLSSHCKAQLQPYLSYSKSTMIERHR